jgi:hypothetical protein
MAMVFRKSDTNNQMATKNVLVLECLVWAKRNHLNTGIVRFQDVDCVHIYNLTLNQVCIEYVPETVHFSHICNEVICGFSFVDYSASTMDNGEGKLLIITFSVW